MIFDEFCSSKGSFHEFSALLTSQQNGVVERKNEILQEMAQVMLHVKCLPLHFLAEALNTVCHIHNCISLHLSTTLTNYQL